MPESEYEAGRERLDDLSGWWGEHGESRRNEATTRLHLIDKLLTDVLSWPVDHVVAEESHGGVYADYALGIPARRLIVEAKREGVYFELPVGTGPGVIQLRTIIEHNPHLESAVRQVLGYCHDRGVPIAAVANGHQIVAFLANRQDGVPPLEGRALVFDSLAAMQSGFPALWNNLSRPGIDSLRLHATLGEGDVSAPPPKLAGSLPNYPGYRVRNRIQTELKIVADLVLHDIVHAPEFEEQFLRQCYSTSETLSEYAVVSRKILEARYSALAAFEEPVETANPRTSSGITSTLQSDIVAGSLSRRPLILLGDVGVGKTMFIRHFVKIDARDVMEESIRLHIDFGSEPALADNLNTYVMTRFEQQLAEYGVDVYADKFVRNVYKSELRSFATGVHGRLKRSHPDEYELKEIEFLERKLSATDQHLQASLKYASRSLRKQIVVFLDNIDQRDFPFQEQVFLIAQSLAATWPATVFLSLRPDTFYHSRVAGALTAYQPRVFVISPPSIKEVIRKRLTYCLSLVESPEARSRILPESLDTQVATLATYLAVLEGSFRRSRRLVEFVDNLSDGNVREALAFLTTFVGSGHVDTKKILDIQTTDGGYTVALHEFTKAVMYGDRQHFDPRSSPMADVFELSTNDGREHFLLLMLLAFVEQTGVVGGRDGFVDAEPLASFAQGLGFLPVQIEFALRHGVDKRLLELRPQRDDSSPRQYRVTTVGAYTRKKLVSRFVYFDAIVVDVPVVDPETLQSLRDCSDLDDRLERADVLRRYLDTQWLSLQGLDATIDWPTISKELTKDMRWVRKSASRQRDRH